MPRRPLIEPTGGWLARFKHWLKDRRTWTSVVYLAAQLPLGVAYFTIVVAGTAVGGWLLVVARVVTGWYARYAKWMLVGSLGQLRSDR